MTDTAPAARPDPADVLGPPPPRPPLSTRDPFYPIRPASPLITDLTRGIRDQLTARGLNQVDLARHLGMQASTLSALLADWKAPPPRVARLEYLLAALGLRARIVLEPLHPEAEHPDQPAATPTPEENR